MHMEAKAGSSTQRGGFPFFAGLLPALEPPFRISLPAPWSASPLSPMGFDTSWFAPLTSSSGPLAAALAASGDVFCGLYAASGSSDASESRPDLVPSVPFFLSEFRSCVSL